jgi:hypothetical protein
MARQNHNVNYMYDVDGETVWEKLRTIRSMLDDRQRAYQHATLARDENEKKHKKDTTSLKYKQWLIDKDFNESLIQDCVNEVKFLEAFESFLAAEAEKTRIPGKTDDEMYEINYFHEMEVRLVRHAQAQIMTRGVLDEELMLRLMKNRNALNLCIEQGLISEQVTEVIDNPILPAYSTHSALFLESTVKGKELVEHELPMIGQPKSKKKK